MLTQYDKFLAPLLIFVIGWLNQKFGWQFSTDPANVQAVIGALMLIVTFLVPNKVTTGQAATAVAGVQLGTTSGDVKAAANVIVQDAKAGKAGA